jgi:serine/threonine-protein phosphatase 5
MLAQVIFSNRAMVYIKLRQPELAMADCAKSLQHGYTSKAAYRHGVAALALGLHADALRSFEAVLQRDPQNREARSKAKECRQMLREEEGGELDVEGGQQGGEDKQPVDEDAML